MYDKEFLYAYDLQGRDVNVTIERVQAGSIKGTGGKSSKKPVIYFKGAKKGLALCITNARTIAAMNGGSFKSEDWLGKRITLYPTKTQFGGAEVDCIRIRPSAPKGNVKDAPPVEEQHDTREPGSDDNEEAAV
jgi:hypothetical protein